jgi:hypothetical protein
MRALNPDAVVFEFESTDLDPIMILEIVFGSSESTQPGKDLEVTINRHQRFSLGDEARRKPIKVNLSYVPLRLYNSLDTKLKHALTPYGNVLQVRKYTDPLGRFLG